MAEPHGSLIPPGYRQRLINPLAQELLLTFGGLLIRGPKYCGKTWTGRSLANSEFSLMDSENAPVDLELLQSAPGLALQGASPHLVDEWQELPTLWDMVRNAIDASNKERLFILTGSSTPRAFKPRHSGVGRIAKINMRPMSLFESGHSNGIVSLKGLFDGLDVQGVSPLVDVSELANLVVRGGWPGISQTSASSPGLVATNYIESFIEEDMHRIDEQRRDAGKMERLMQSLARNAEQAATPKTLIRDMTEDALHAPLAAETVDDYMDVLERAFILETIGPWSPNVRSSMRLNKKPKYHYVDPSLPAAILKMAPSMLLGDFEAFGFLFESLCMRDLLVYAQAMNARVFYYRDRDDLEIDAVVEAPDGSWGGIEIKLGHHQVEKAASNLKSVRRKIVDAGGREPVFLAVVEGVSSYAYRRQDGVYVVPIATLGA